LKLKYRHSTNASCCEFLARTYDIQKEKKRKRKRERERERERKRIKAYMQNWRERRNPAGTHPERKGVTSAPPAKEVINATQ